MAGGDGRSGGQRRRRSVEAAVNVAEVAVEGGDRGSGWRSTESAVDGGRDRRRQRPEAAVVAANGSGKESAIKNYLLGIGL